jgi:flagellar motility protein MotE (MotC chaperone)
MTRFIRDFRLIPVVLIATISLFALKSLGLVFDGGYLFDQTSGQTAEDIDITGTIAKPKMPVATVQPRPTTTPPKQSWAQEMFNFPDVTGSVDSKAVPAPETGAVKSNRSAPTDPPLTPGGTPVSLGQPASPSERAILERLAERRAELDARDREMEMRENLLKAAEKRLEGRVAELKDLEARVNNAVHVKEESDAARFKNLVAMYDNMKAKDAAKIFDRLDINVLIEVSSQLNPRRMSDILAQMSPEAAQRLTVELAARPRDKGDPADLPKIEGRPVAN